jgi:hypothetical protein
MRAARNEQAPWTTPFDWELEAASNLQTHLSFAEYVAHKSLLPADSNFEQFPKLPKELQQRVFYFCEIPTLFQLMQVSFAIRTEAEKYFWSDPGAWFYIDATFLLAGGSPGHTLYDVDFLAQVKHLEVGFSDMSQLTNNWETERTPTWQPDESPVDLLERSYRQPNESPVDLTEPIGHFWQALRRVFPRLTHVVMSENWIGKVDQSLPEDLKSLVSMRPAGINVAASFLYFPTDQPYPMERSLWRPKEAKTGLEEERMEITSTWRRRSIHPPPKQFYGPVGTWLHSEYLHGLRFEKQQSVRARLFEAIERHHFQGRCEPILCSRPDCKARFELPYQWTVHALNSGHGWRAVPPDHYVCVLEQQNKVIEGISDQIDLLNEKMWDSWGEKGSVKRRDAEQAFLHQLDHDPLYSVGKPAKNTMTWRIYSLSMNTAKRDHVRVG